MTEKDAEDFAIANQGKKYIANAGVFSETFIIAGYGSLQKSSWLILEGQEHKIRDSFADMHRAYISTVGARLILLGERYRDIHSWRYKKVFIQIYVLDILTEITEPAIDLSRYPNKCTACQSPAWIGITTLDCSNDSCRHFRIPKE